MVIWNTKSYIDQITPATGNLCGLSRPLWNCATDCEKTEIWTNQIIVKK